MNAVVNLWKIECNFDTKNNFFEFLPTDWNSQKRKYWCILNDANNNIIIWLFLTVMLGSYVFEHLKIIYILWTYNDRYAVHECQLAVVKVLSCATESYYFARLCKPSVKITQLSAQWRHDLQLSPSKYRQYNPILRTVDIANKPLQILANREGGVEIAVFIVILQCVSKQKFTTVGL